MTSSNEFDCQTLGKNEKQILGHPVGTPVYGPIIIHQTTMYVMCVCSGTYTQRNNNQKMTIQINSRITKYLRDHNPLSCENKRTLYRRAGQFACVFDNAVMPRSAFDQVQFLTTSSGDSQYNGTWRRRCRRGLRFDTMIRCDTPLTGILKYRIHLERTSSDTIQRRRWGRDTILTCICHDLVLIRRVCSLVRFFVFTETLHEFFCSVRR